MALVKKRTAAKSSRQRFLYTDVTEAEYEVIREHCRKRGISVSEFMADLMLKEARKGKNRNDQRSVVVQPTLTLTAQEYAKLELLVRLHQKDSPEDYILDLLQPEFELRRVYAPAKVKSLRYYFSDEEHEVVMKHINHIGMTAQTFTAMVVAKAIRKSRKKAPSKKRRKG
jgi:hypothetical protein